ncbi:hypothetical protein BJ138DRAFT_1230398 [Hygrophoropsis aurantiaca]|uniref:Uncharacterized protein n=1 Tax=Hygrophoropsis aurantiaca TaxID=72124 RepID=A0ACB7ZWM1_9AGAM|nr:hypothetical protein BJ138DRAFT_1230398 [Hygrophoropsis aurantiaca]
MVVSRTHRHVRLGIFATCKAYPVPVIVQTPNFARAWGPSETTPRCRGASFRNCSSAIFELDVEDSDGSERPILIAARVLPKSRPCVFPFSSTLVPAFVHACSRLRPRLSPPSSTLVPALVHACSRFRPRLSPPSSKLAPAFVQAADDAVDPCIPAKSGWDKLPPPNVSRPSTLKKVAKSQEKSSGASASKLKPARQSRSRHVKVEAGTSKSKPARHSRSQHEQRLCLFFYAPQRHDTLDPGASIDDPNPNHRCSARSTTTTPAAEKLSGSTSSPPKAKPAKEPSPSDLVSLPATVAKPKLSQKAAGRGDSDTAPNVDAPAEPKWGFVEPSNSPHPKNPPSPATVKPRAWINSRTETQHDPRQTTYGWNYRPDVPPPAHRPPEKLPIEIEMMLGSLKSSESPC